MIAEPVTLRSNKFQLSLPFSYLQQCYPSIAHSFTQMTDNHNSILRQSDKFLKLEIILYFTSQDKQPISYKLVKTQRLLTILSRLSRSLKSLIPVQEVLKIQNSSQKTTKKEHSSSSFKNKLGQCKKQVSQNILDESIQFYTQKGWDFFQQYIDRHNAVIVVLRKSPNYYFLENDLNNQSHLIELKTYFNNLIKQQLGKIQKLTQNEYLVQQLSKQFRQSLIIFITKLSEKYESLINQLIEQLQQRAEKDSIINDFLNGTHKFYKHEIFEHNEIYNFRNAKILQRLQENIQYAAKHLFKIFIIQNHQQSHIHKSNDKIHHFSSQQENHSNQNQNGFQSKKFKSEKQLKNLRDIDVQKMGFVLDWNLQDIEKSSLYLQSIHLYLNKKNQKQTLNSDLQSIKQFVAKKFSSEFRRQLVLIAYQLGSNILSQEDFNSIGESLQIQLSQSLMKLEKKKMPEQNGQYAQNESNNGPNLMQFQCYQSEEMSVLNEKLALEEQSRKKNDRKGGMNKVPSVRLGVNESMQLLGLFYKYYFTTIHCFLSCEKQWYFSNLKVKDHNMTDHYKTMVRWIPLQKKYNPNSRNPQSKGNDSFNSFLYYIISLVYTLMEVKNTIKNNQNQHSNLLISQMDIEQFNPHYLQQQRPGEFIYNQLSNCLAYDNFSFQNIQHCHYYLRNCSTDTRHQFQDRTWADLMTTENIRLFIKSTKKSTSKTSKNKMKDITFKERQMLRIEEQNESIRLISIPVRGRYCRHLDFFDLCQVYPLIYPEPYCQPKSFNCPKCMIEMQFEELIYLKEVEIILELVRMFYLQSDKTGINFKLRKVIFRNENTKVWPDNPAAIKKKIKQLLLQQKYTKKTQQPIKQKYTLKDLRLVVNHQNQSVSIKGKYEICPLDTVVNQQSDDEQSQNYDQYYQIQNSDQNQQRVNFDQSFCQLSLQAFSHQFIHPLESEIYHTLLNPNNKFKSNKKLKSILTNYGKPKTSKQIFSFNDSNRSIDEFNYSGLDFNQQISLARKVTNNRWQLYKDLQKGTIAI